ncbi:CocE/NonD family hydrolase [Streptomyces cavernicola]|uniref:CocE/NonD family hydrolase n=1 Tax=Streptomyces cavernicola TaxID=3043613 RepID=A0ABT6S5M4_9ACTN|nr:CocE/NonD family hydrolase [Streptomyces sp. B-S-A6]MDI3403209.1 CocE/NonD family hydrolase [Streptomyces sp. B-S-A6]
MARDASPSADTEDRPGISRPRNRRRSSMTQQPAFGSYRLRRPRMSPESRGGRLPEYRRTEEDGMLIERDIAVTMRTGDRIYVDVFRPLTADEAPTLVSWMPYGKHNPLPIQVIFPNGEVDQEWTSRHTVFESPDPMYWVAHGYAVVLADLPGTWNSEGVATYLSPEEAEAHYDLIEWAGTRDWSNGRVGLTGVSYLAAAQWRVAELAPPHLAAINPWEGFTDPYREVVRHGGIPSTWMWPYLWDRWGASRTQIEDLELETAEHPFDDAFWRSKASNLEKIQTPAYVVASWCDQGLHTRGTLEGYKRISSDQKWLEVHGQKKWAYYYRPENVDRLRAFFDHFLRGQETEVASWPPVRLEVRESTSHGEMVNEQEWPLARTTYRQLFLDADNGSLTWDRVQDEHVAVYDGAGSGPGRHRAEFEVTFQEDLDLVGHMKLALYVSAEAADMDLFVAVWKIDREGRIVHFPYYGHLDDGPAAVGWIRASHRELDEAESTEYMPVLKHQRSLQLQPGDVTRLDIEILASGTRYRAGDSLRVVVQGTDINRYPKPLVFARHEDTVNTGTHTIHTGGRFPSHLLVPVTNL